MSHTYTTFVISTLALAGVFPLAGFWSKDEILVGAYSGQVSRYPLMFVFGCVVAFLTAAYMTRVIWYTFHGEYRGHGVPHESPAVMVAPLWILAGLAVLGGLANLPQAAADWIPGFGGLAHRIETWAEPVEFLEQFETFAVPEPLLWVALAGTALALAGIGLAYLYYWRDKGPHGLTSRSRLAHGGYTFLANKYYLDHLYTDVIVASIKGPIARAVYWFDRNVIDRVVNSTAEGARDSGRLVYRYIDQGVVDRAVNEIGDGAELGGEGLRVIQSGRVQQYGALLFGAAAVLAVVFVIVL
jgi:NADH-quinone oxidoreductase subunit L